MAGRISSVVSHSTLPTRELSSSCSHPPSSKNHRCSNASAALHTSLSRPPPFIPPPLTHHTAALHPSLRHSSLPAFRRTYYLPSSSSSSSNWARRATAAVAMRQVANPSTERRMELATISSSKRTSMDLLRIPLRTVDTRQAHYSAIYECNSPSQASRRPTAAPPSTTDRHRPPTVPITFNRHPPSYDSPNGAYQRPHKPLLAQQKIQRHP
jgi:hypothetical protein